MTLPQLARLATLRATYLEGLCRVNKKPALCGLLKSFKSLADTTPLANPSSHAMSWSYSFCLSIAYPKDEQRSSIWSIRKWFVQFNQRYTIEHMSYNALVIRRKSSIIMVVNKPYKRTKRPVVEHRTLLGHIALGGATCP